MITFSLLKDDSGRVAEPLMLRIDGLGFLV